MILKRAIHKTTAIVILMVFPFIFGCGEDKVVIPDHVIPKDKMVLVMTDVHVAEAILIQGHTTDSESSPEAYYAGIYELHNITEKQFEESYRFYMDHPELFKEVYSEVLIELSKQQAKVAN